MSGSRILFYSHDTFGLGHIRRTQKIANALASPHRSMLIACASPKASSYASQPGIDYLNLPGFTKQPTGDYSPRSLRVSVEEFTNLRSQLLLSAVRSFRPEIVFIDKEPLGVKGELYPALDYIRNHLRSTHVICGFRDILDEPQSVANEWHRRDTVRTLERFFDSIFIYGEREIYDLEEEYGLPDSLRAKVRYTGYIHPSSTLDATEEGLGLTDPALPLVTLTLGGGGDGQDILKVFLDYLRGFEETRKNNYLVLTGPFVGGELLRLATQLQASSPNVVLREFMPNPLSVFARSQLVISMGGYNTMCELAALGQKALVLPRVTPRQEQLIRARAFQSRGLCDYLHPSELSPETLAAAIGERLANPQTASPFKTRGLQSLLEFVEERESR